MRTILSIMLQQIYMVIKVPLVALFAFLIIFIPAKMGIGSKKTRNFVGYLFLIIFILTFIMAIFLLTKSIGLILLEISVLSFVAAIIVFVTTYLLEFHTISTSPRSKKIIKKFSVDKIYKKNPKKKTSS